MTDRLVNSHYQVPRRFGLRTILVVTALFAGLLSVAKWTDISLPILFAYASFVLVVAVSQVVMHRWPRLSSILAGAFFIPSVKLEIFLSNASDEVINTGPVTGLFTVGDGVTEQVIRFVYLVIFGALYGYLTGTLLAGLYLVLDQVQRAMDWRFRHSGMPTQAS